MRNLLLLLLPMLLPLTAPAQDAVPDDGENRRYRVEIIIFAYNQADSIGTETFVPERLPDENEEIPSFGDTATPAMAGDTPLDELRYRILDTAELELNDTWGMLSRLQAYKPLMRFGWVQEVVADAETPPLALQRFGTPPPGLDGTVNLALSRFLHLGVDVTLAADAAPLAPVPATVPARDALAGDVVPGADVRYAPLSYEIRETRIMKSGETRYYDHPYFGIIARVTRADDPAADGSGS
jgi:Peptidoglycan-binding protein, CsiV